MIRAVERYVESAKEEVRILKELKKQDKNNYIVKLYDNFSFGHNYCMIFEKLQHSFHDILKDEKYKGNYETIQKYAQQILMQLEFVHELGITHTDLKPENILLENPEKCKIIDYGNAT